MASDRDILPDWVVPTKYSVTLEPSFTTFKAKGHEEIAVTVKKATSKIIVHSKQITIDSVEVVANGNTIKSKEITFDEKEDRVTFEFGQELPLGEASLNIKFEALLNDDMAGFYRSKYTVNGEQRWMATTQFEATDARRAFPCWDEPAVKAIFEITLVVPTDRVALSNMLPAEEKVNGDTKTIRFDPSPIMSTYLVAMIVGEFDYVETHTEDAQKTRVRVYTPVGKKAWGEFALGVASKTLTYFAEYFKIPYPLPKMDMVAIADFSAGAMENWGLVTYREIALLVDKESASISAKQRVAYVVAHELAHQWFGNYVTMEWWSQLWLNEGFATFVGNLAINALYPEWKIWTQFVNDYQSTAFALDSLKNSHPIEVAVKSSAQINEIFDAISYNKGSCVIRMVEKLLPEGKFQEGLNVYLNRHAYKNAVTEDLWQALGETSKFDVKTFMDTYTKKVGYPLVSVKRGAKEGTLEVTQEKFVGGEAGEDDSTLWNVSVDIKHQNGKDVIRQQFNGKDGVLEIKGVSKDEWVKLNYGQAGYYRVRYSEDLLQQLLAPLSSKDALNAEDRLGVQNDVFALAKALSIKTGQYLDVMSAMKDEQEYVVWASMAANIGEIQSLFRQDKEVSASLGKFVTKIFTPLYDRLGWEPKGKEKDTDALLRSIVLRKLAGAKYEPVLTEARKRFDAAVKDLSTLSADLRTPVFEAVSKNGDENTFNQLVEIYKKTDSAEVKSVILQTISLQSTPELVKKALEWSLGPDVRDQDLYLLFLNAAGTSYGSDVAWTFFKDNWDTYFKRLSNGYLLLARICGKSTEKFNTEEQAKDVEAFFAAHPFEPAARTIKQSLEYIRRNVQWMESRGDVASWLSSHGF